MAKTKLVISGPQGSRNILLAPGGVTLGRGSSCDVTLDKETVSRHHARIYQDHFGRWIVEDLDSQNGVFIEGRRVKTQAVLPDEQISIRPFTLSLLEESKPQTLVISSARSTLPIVDKGLEESIVSYRPDRSVTLSPTLIGGLNELRTRLLGLCNPSELYSEASLCLGKRLDTLVAIVRLTRGSEPLPPSPEMLACCMGAAGGDEGLDEASRLHLSKRVLEAVRSMDAPVMATSSTSSDQKLQLTIVDEHKPHVVFAAQVNDLGQSVDALYIDILEDRSSPQMFDFVEAVASQVNFVQKSLFLTELKKQEKALRQANVQLKEKDRIKDEYVSRVTHDIKGHLATIRSCLFVVADDACEVLGDKQADFLSRAQSRTEQLLSFVKELLNLTQMRLSGRLETEAFSLADSISKSLAAVARKADDKSITVTSNVDPAIGEIVGNEFSINEMITNLLFNAVKYTPEQKTVHLEAKSCDDNVQIDICDTGIGIPAEDVPNVFEEFFRAGNAKKREKDGTGLGLSIVKQIVDRHGGEISVQSQEGQGSTFSAILPKSNPAFG
jgi:signal transduction histidine kinase